MDSFEQEGLELLRQLTGNSAADFRDGQLEAIRTVAEERRSALVVQRTGWGKSAVYLIATRVTRTRGGGPTIIVSPLLALMRNQVAMTERVGLSASTINSTNRTQWAAEFQRIKEDAVDILLISPERLANTEFRETLMVDLFNSTGLLVIDEVHCISDWGHDFRPDYRRLRQVVDALPPNIPVLGTTATANDRVVRDVEEQLGNNLRLFRGTLERDSLSLHVLSMPNKAERMAWLAQNIPLLPGSGIVYCLTIRDAERLAEWLRDNGIDAEAYTGPTPDDHRLDIEERLTSGQLKAVVATSALSMGYDNPHIQYVVHYQTPGSAVAYYQQVGRAGRAVDRAFGIALSGWEDTDIQDYFIATAFPSEVDTRAVLDVLAKGEGVTLGQVERHVNLRRSRVEAMLKILEVEGAIYKRDRLWYRSALRWSYPTDRVDEVTTARKSEQSAMQEYLSTDGCLMEFLRAELDDPGAAPCGRCANCAGPVFDSAVDRDIANRAVQALQRQHVPIAPRKVMPSDLEFPFDPKQHAVSEGLTLTNWGDPGLAESVARGKYQDGRYDDDVVEAMAAMIRTWSPAPRPQWVTWVPSSSLAVEDFASRLGVLLGLDAVQSLRRVRPGRPQKEMENSFQQAANVLGAFEVTSFRTGPVLLVDDMVDSRWTFTVAGGQLRAAGVEAVYPVALTDTSQGGQ